MNSVLLPSVCCVLFDIITTYFIEFIWVSIIEYYFHQHNFDLFEDSYFIPWRRQTFSNLYFEVNYQEKFNTCVSGRHINTVWYDIYTWCKAMQTLLHVVNLVSYYCRLLILCNIMFTIYKWYIIILVMIKTQTSSHQRDWWSIRSKVSCGWTLSKYLSSLFEL